MKIRLKAECKFTLESERGTKADAGTITAETGWTEWREHCQIGEMVNAVVIALSHCGLDEGALKKVGIE